MVFIFPNPFYYTEFGTGHNVKSFENASFHLNLIVLKAAESMLARMRAKPGKTIRNRRELKRTLASYISANLFFKISSNRSYLEK